jgi:hypothetical protein
MESKRLQWHRRDSITPTTNMVSKERKNLEKFFLIKNNLIKKL